MTAKRIGVFVFGLSRAGKSTIVEYFRQKKFVPQTPTMGVSISQLIFQKLVLEFTDVGGQEAFRKQWNSYLAKPHVLVFVIDALNRDANHIADAKEELERMLKNPKVAGTPLLVIVNKIDEPLAMAKNVVIERYGLHDYADRDSAIYEVSARTGTNMDAVLNAMTSIVLKDEAIEYFVSEEIKQLSRTMLSSYKEFYQKGTDNFKDGKLEDALACFNLAKEISSNLFQFGILPSGKEYQKLTNAIIRVQKAIDDKEKAEAEQPRQSYLGALKDEATAVEKRDSKAFKVISIFLFGLDRAGKTTFIEYLKNDSFKDQAPTLGLNLSHLVLGNVRFVFNDLGGQQAFRAGWMQYWKGQDLLIFIVDAADAARFGEARDALWSILKHPDTRGKPLLVLVNKVDLPEAKPLVLVRSALDYDDIDRAPKAIFETSVKGNYNLDKALNFIVSLVLQDSEMEKFVSREIKRLIKNYKAMFDAYVKEARVLEKSKDLQTAYNRVYKAKMIQEELFKHGDARAQKEIKKLDQWLSKLHGQFG
ncbi:MAG: GTP-binding protein [Candidatus Lokiarchaeota archaeon]|nr:GTP-binding protein [Candidatus Lokiarchaeota archaeon]